MRTAAHLEIGTPTALRVGYLARLERLLRLRWRPIAAFILLLDTVEWTRSYSVSEGDPVGMLFGGGDFLLVQATTMGMSAVFGAMLGEAVAWRGWRGAALIVFATVAATGAGVTAFFLVAENWISLEILNARILSPTTFAVRCVWFYSMAGLLFAAYTKTRERDLATARAAQAAELARAESQRGLYESHLKVLQARVEPELLFGALADVERLYRRNPAGADALLDDLIVYLRAALPQMRRGASTLAKEAELAQAYLKVVPAGREGLLATEVRISPEHADAPFPPMVFLPLAHAAGKVRAARVDIVVMAEDTDPLLAGRLCATVGIDAPDALEGWLDADMEAIRATMYQYFGEGASLDVARKGERWAIVATWPAPNPE